MNTPAAEKTMNFFMPDSVRSYISYLLAKTQCLKQISIPNKIYQDAIRLLGLISQK
jgi:hypothetical protein|tara:strand:+ start:173 stop:340 length:168 start_codon:yes stop_codon:yes gene_type:complete